VKELENLYANQPKSRTFFERKVEVSGARILLKGSVCCGKKELTKHYLAGFKRSFFIDLDDLRNQNLNLSNLDKFVAKNGIEAVGISGLKTPVKVACKNVIFTTTRRDLKLFDGENGGENFREFQIYGLDYEEFISFFKKNFDAKTLFSFFLKMGNFPHSAISENASDQTLQETIKANFSPLEVEILREIATQNGEFLNVMALYKRLKERVKISKDTLYNAIYKFENEFVVSLVGSVKGGKFSRIYLNNFALKHALTFDKNPKNTIKNMVFCELAKFGELFFSDVVDFFVPNLHVAVKVEPFLDADFVVLWFKKNLPHFKALGVRKVEVVSNATTHKFAFEGVTCEILPFWEWSVLR